MGELVAWGLGFILGIAYPRPLASRLRAVGFGAIAVGGGAAVTVLAGEWEASPGLILVDAGQIALAASIAAFVKPFVVRHFKLGHVGAARRSS